MFQVKKPSIGPINGRKYLGNYGYLKVKIDGLPIPKGRLVKGPYKPICKDCAIYFSITVPPPKLVEFQAPKNPTPKPSKTAGLKLRTYCGNSGATGEVTRKPVLCRSYHMYMYMSIEMPSEIALRNFGFQKSRIFCCFLS